MKTTLRWIARVLGTLILVLFLPFYFGYGNPLPFLKEGATAHDNAWLCAFPLMFLGMIVGWFSGRWAAVLIIVPILAAQIVSYATQQSWAPHMLVPALIGVLFWISSSKKEQPSQPESFPANHSS